MFRSSIFAITRFLYIAKFYIRLLLKSIAATLAILPFSMSDLRAHIGALIAQTMNGWTDRQTKEMVLYHVGVRLLCGLEGTTTTMDRTRIEAFRNCVGKSCVEELNQLVLRSAVGAGFTGVEICATDTTV